MSNKRFFSLLAAAVVIASLFGWYANAANKPKPSHIEPVVTAVRDFANSLVGVDEGTAKKLALGMGYQFRVIKRDGKDLAATKDFIETRIDVEIEDGRVASASVG